MMVREARDIAREMLANPAGATVTADYARTVPAVGFVVGVRGIVTDTADVETVAQWVAENVADVAATADRYFGVWIDTDTGTAYFDVVDVLADRMEALSVARDRGELAIYDIEAGEEIRVN